MKVKGLLFESATTNHFLSVVCAVNAEDTRKIGFEFRYRVASKFSTNNTMQIKGRLSFDCGKLSFEGAPLNALMTFYELRLFLLKSRKIPPPIIARSPIIEPVTATI